MNNRGILALIPARGGSKGIPRKNLLPLRGKPAIAYSIEHALRSRHIGRCIVSTDDEEIAVVSRQFGAEVPYLRPAEFAGDKSPDIDVFRHAIEWLAANESYEAELIVHLRPSGPVRDVDLIDKAIEMMLSHPEADALRSVSIAIQTPFKMWFGTGEGFLLPVLTLDGVKDPQSTPRQDLPLVYWQNGYVDIVRPRAILRHGRMWGGKALAFVIEESLFELDYPDNIAGVEQALEQLESGEKKIVESTPVRHPV